MSVLSLHSLSRRVMIKKFKYNGRALKHETESAAKELIITKRKIKSEIALKKVKCASASAL
jgi:hypothetical protein